jgi:hypothetical protein
MMMRKKVGAAAPTGLVGKYPHRDHLGSVVAISDAGGALTERSGFDPRGKRTLLGEHPLATPRSRWLVDEVVVSWRVDWNCALAHEDARKVHANHRRTARTIAPEHGESLPQLGRATLLLILN